MSNKRTGAKIVKGPCIKCGKYTEGPGHHIVTRGSGGSSMVIPEVPVCADPCHDSITRNPSEAYRGGFMYKRNSPEGRAIVGEALACDPWIFKFLSDLVRIQLDKPCQHVGYLGEQYGQ